MRKDTAGAKTLKKKMDRLTEPEKRLVLAYIRGMVTGTALKNERPKPGT